VEPDDCVAPTISPPATPPTTRAAPTSTHSNHRRRLCECVPLVHIGSSFRATEPLSGDSERTSRRMY
jgi:hypothetical protein